VNLFSTLATDYENNT